MNHKSFNIPSHLQTRYEQIMGWGKKRRFRQKIKPLFATALAILTLLLPIVWLVTSQPKAAEAGWWDDNWYYRKSVSITNSGSAQTDYQVMVTLDTATLITNSKMQSDCDDIRFTDINGSILYHWIEENSPGCNNAATEIWVKVPSIPTSGATIYVYYGSPSASNTEDGNEVFEFFDDFSGSAVDAGKWTGHTSNFTVSSGQLTGSDTTYRIKSSTAFTGDYKAFTRHYTTTYATNGHMSLGFFASTSNAYGALPITTDVWYTRNDTTWPSQGAMEFNQWTIQVLEVVGTAGTVDITGETSGSDSASDTNSGLSSENLTLGTRYDDLNTGETYDADWDWIFVVKTASTEPSVGSPGSEVQAETAPVAHWRFDEGYDTTTYDESPNNNDGSMTNMDAATDWVTGKYGKALDFDADNDYVEITRDSSIEPSQLSVSAWIYIDSNLTPETMGVIFDKAHTSHADPYYDYHLRLADIDDTPTLDGYVVVGGLSGDDEVFCPSCLTKDEWYHVAMTFDEQNIKLYINGVLRDTQANPGSITYHNTNLFIGAYRNLTTGNFPGKIDEAKVYNYARTADQIKTDYQLGPSHGAGAVLGAGSENAGNLPVSWWKLDEGSSTNAYDSGSAENTGVLTNMDASTDWVAGKYGKALDFDGGNDYIDLGAPASLDIDPPLTVEMWIKRDPNSSACNDFLFLGNNNTDDGIKNGVILDANCKIGIDQNPPGGFITSSTVIQKNAWYHVAAVFDTSQTYIYVNGQLDGQGTTKTYSGVTPTKWLIGTRLYPASSAYYFYGLIDNVKVYNYARAVEQIRQDMLGRTGGAIMAAARADTSVVGHWRFDESYSTTAYDESSNNNDGALTNMEAASDWVSGRYGKALDFDGSNEYVSIADNSSLNFTDGEDFTVSFWFNRDTFTTDDTVVAKKNDQTDATAGYVVWIDDSTDDVRLVVSDGDSTNLHTVDSTTSFTSSGWHHVAVVYDDSSSTASKIYIDGKDDSATNTTTGTFADIDDLSNAVVLAIGAESDAGEPFDGKIDEVRVYNFPLSASQVKADLNFASAVYLGAGSEFAQFGGSQPISWWKLNEASGTNAYDTGSAENTGTLTNMAASTDWVPGKTGKALDFDGSDEYIDITDSSGLKSFSEGTVSFWVNFDATSGQVFTVGDADASSYYVIGTDSSKIGVRYMKAGVDQLQANISDSITTGQWYHVAFTVDSSGNKMYVDGNEKALTYSDGSASTSLFFSDNDTNWDNVQIARRNSHSSPGGYHNGKIDEVKIYNYARTTPQVAYDYNRGKPAGHWRFDEGEGIIAYDESDNDNDGDLTNMEAADWVTGKFNSALDFDGSDEYVDIGNPTNGSLDFDTENFTVELWIKGSGSGSEWLIDKYGSGWGPGYRIIFYSGNLEFETGDGSAKTEVNIAEGSLRDGNWHHIVARRNGSDVSLFIDGGSPTTSSGTIRDVDNSTDFLIGGLASSDRFDGVIDDVRVYNYARTAEQIKLDYNNGAAVRFE